MTECELLQRSDIQLRFAALHMPEPNSGCWLWLGWAPHDRARFRLQRNRPIYSSRASYQIYTGRPIPVGLLVLHKCDNSFCVNPLHLKTGTQKDNIRDKSLRRRHPHYAITEEVALSIIAAQGSASAGAIARQYGVSRALVRGIWDGKRWPHLPRQSIRV